MPTALRQRRDPGPWYGRFKERLTFERGVHTLYPNLRSARMRRGWLYTLDAKVPHYGTLPIAIHFEAARALSPKITVPGPTSPHRFPDGSLCIWFGRDPASDRWVFADGLADLITLARVHLFKEAWWRDSTEWLGGEAPHDVKGALH